MEQPALRTHPERTAWVVVWIAFAVFCLVVVCVPLGVRHLLLYSTVEHPAVLQTLEGTAVVDNPAAGSEFAVTKDTRDEKMRTLSEGMVISLDEGSRAFIHFFDGSSLHLLPGSRVYLDQMRGPRFDMGVRPNTIYVRVVTGRVKVVTAAPRRAAGLDYRLRFPLLDSEVVITSDGLYGIEVEPDGAQVFANQGSAVVTANGKSVQLVAGERSTIEAGHQPVGPTEDAREMVSNGDFSDDLEVGWGLYNDQGNDGGDVDGTAVKVTDDGQPAVRFRRTDSNNNHCETILEQTINRDLPDPVTSLEVRAMVKLVNQSLSGGGYLGSEFPLMIRLRYRDAYGSENEWVQGFYYENPQSSPCGTAVLYPRDTWQPFYSGNLLDMLDPKPYRILSVKVTAAGWDYESLVRWISVAVK
jgi:hypothetical protein